jgi:DNA-binding HxlR family transcriptional regulator
MPTRNKQHSDYCPFEQAMDLLSSKWKGMIMFELQDAQLRYSELQNLLPGISNRMLTRTLTALENDKIVIKTPLANHEDIFTYTLSPIGKKFMPAFIVVRDWALEYKRMRGNEK